MIMKPMNAAVCLFALCLAIPAPAMAGRSPDPSRLPACTSAGNDGACRLPVHDGGFSIGGLGKWQRQGLPGVGSDPSGNAYAVLPVGAAISQAVAIPTGNLPEDATYAVRIRVLGERADGSVDLRVAMSDDRGGRRLDLGGTSVRVVRGEWTEAELFVSGARHGGAPHVLVEIANDSLTGTQVQVDDVYVIESIGTDAS
jgi:hypothetical protein